MKTKVIIITAAIAASGLLSKLSAQETNQGQISDIQNNLVTVEDLDVFGEAPRRIEVRIVDEYDKSIFTEHRWKEESTTVAYDFSLLHDGIYKVKLFRKNQLLCSKVINKQTSIQNKQTSIETEDQLASLSSQEK